MHAETSLELTPSRDFGIGRIDEAKVDVELASEARAEAERAVQSAEDAAATAVERLLHERLSVAEVVKLTGLDQPTVRRLRQIVSRESNLGGGQPKP